VDYDAIVFDNDGVLARITEREAVREAIADTLAEFGVENPPQEHIERLFGVTIEDVMAVCSEYDIDPAAFWERRDRNVADAQIELIRAGRKDLYDDVAALDRLESPMGVVSNNQHETVEYILRHYGVDEQFHTVYGRQPTLEDVRRKKPEPYYLEQAIDDLGADRTLYVGDSPSDLVAARRAGADGAFVRRDHRVDTELPHTPEYEVRSLHTLVDQLEA